MSWWKDIFFSWWLIVCQFFGFQSLETFGPDEGTITHIDFQPTSSFIPPNLYPDLLNLEPSDRVNYTCLDNKFQNRIRDLRPPVDGHACNTPDTRQTWCIREGGTKPTHLCYNYELALRDGIQIGFPKHIEQKQKITVEITYGDIAPDGYLKKNAMLINGKYPGELIEAWWGQTIELTVINKLGVNPGEISNGTAIHPHGLRLWHNAPNDGVPGVTQCPIPPGENYTYTWEIQQYGTTWYHSHLSLQYPNGVVAPMILHGPKSGNYDNDLGAILLTDWYHENPFALYSKEIRHTQVPDSTLINGHGKYNCSSVTEPGRCGEGSHWEATFEPEKWHLLRFVNTATSSTFRVSLDNHNMTIITADFTSIRPSKPVDYVDIAVGEFEAEKAFWTNYLQDSRLLGQRYEVLVYANHTKGNFWLRSEPLKCNQNGDHIPDYNVARAIIRYNGSLDVDENPTSHTHLSKNLSHYCKDMDIEHIVPLFARDPGYVEFKKFYNTSRKLPVSLVELPDDHVAKLELGHQSPIKTDWESVSSPKRNLWRILGVPMAVNWTNPALSILEKNPHAKPSDFPEKFAVIEAESGGGHGTNHVIFNINGTILKNKPDGVMHPIHIHGHDFVILAQGRGNFNETDIPKRVHNPVRRDVATMPGDGHLIISFPVDNSGMWLLHCHLAWHASQGLALLILEDEGSASLGTPTLGQDVEPMGFVGRENCRKWEKYMTSTPIPNEMEDSGI
ncbi:hypothetical protein TWF281_006331 [Arthrobotrys megalospora]